MIPQRMILAVSAVIACGTGIHPARATDGSTVAARPALTVQTVSPQEMSLPIRIAAHGNITAWQEASIGSESGGLRISDVRVNVGDRVKRGQVLAVFAAETVAADAAEAEANLAEAEARLEEARANARRGRDLLARGFISPQKLTEFETAERTANARVAAQKAILDARNQRLKQTRITAPDEGLISARAATLGAVPGPGQELFRLIRQGRLEWRAEVVAAELARIRPGMPASVVPVGGEAIPGKVRIVAPTVDGQTRNGLVYVDLPAPGTARVGMFARGEFDLGKSSGLTLPQSAIVTRDGFNYVLRIGKDGRVKQLKVTTGRRIGERVEILAGLDASARVVATGGAFLADGDLVRLAPDTADKR